MSAGPLRRLARLDERVLGPAGRRPLPLARAGPLRLTAAALAVALTAGLVLPWPLGDSRLGRLYAVVGSALALAVVLAVLSFRAL